MPALLTTRCAMPWCLYLTMFLSLTFVSCSEYNTSSEHNISSQQRVGALLDSDNSGGFASVHRAKEFSFPKDHGAHPDYRQERWQFSGNVVTGSGNQLGYELSIQRVGLSATTPPTAEKPPSTGKGTSGNTKQSQWRSKHLYLATLSITDSNKDRFYQTEKSSRQALDMAGVHIVKATSTINDILGDEQSQRGTFAFNIDNWTVTSTSNEIFPLQIQVDHDDMALDLTIYPSKDIKLYGDTGLSQMGPDLGNASYYYGFNRLKTTGKITLNGLAQRIKGDSWYEHEWGTDITGSDIQGVDRYALQFSDGRDFAFYRIRDRENHTHPLSRGIMVFPNGEHENVKQTDVEFEMISEWTSPLSHIHYPISWNIRIPKYRLTIHTTPLVKEQEIHQSRTYWDGAVRVAGYQNVSSTTLKTINGYGYMQLMGYKAAVSSTSPE